MKAEQAPLPGHEPIGTCQRCGRTFVDVFDFQGGLLPDYLPLRLVEYRGGEEATLGEWCGRDCLLDEVTQDPVSVIRRLRPT